MVGEGDSDREPEKKQKKLNRSTAVIRCNYMRGPLPAWNIDETINLLRKICLRVKSRRIACC